MVALSLRRIHVGAHRGAMGYEPENTLRAFRKAIELGTYRIELDVRQTRDGRLVVIHDETIDRTTNGKGYVREMSLSELRNLDAGKGETVPTLEEVLDFVKGKAKLLVEIKEEGMEEKLVQMVETRGMEEDIILSSFLGGSQRVPREFAAAKQRRPQVLTLLDARPVRGISQ